ncbi:MAG: hypothetical protein F6K19_12530 [Cyanothece sp. SIO1E1]|nr:hypothetical protein [Cyanothece sp. SIO1E1]
MKNNALGHKSTDAQAGIYECEIRLKFKLIEEKNAISNKEQLLEVLLEAFAYGADEFLEPSQVHVTAHEVPEIEASPQMRRQLIRLRNIRDSA